MSTADQHAPTGELVTGAVGDRCPNCSATLAPDQRYCVNCGERRGKARFSDETLNSQTVAAPAAAAPPGRRRTSSAATLIAGIATLLIAMGVGFLIGHDSSTSTPVRASSPAVITVGSGAGAAGAATNSGTASNHTASTATKAHAKHAKARVVHVVMSAKVKKAADAAASKVLGSNGNLSNNVQQQVGGSCSGGAGCQGGRFTGNFFPGG